MTKFRPAAAMFALATAAALLPATAAATTSPGHFVKKIDGANSGISSPQDLARDRHGRLYVSDLQSNTILVFGPHARGNAKPVARIKGHATRLDGPTGLLLDTKGHLWVASYYSGKILEYPAGATGNVKPIRTIGGYNTRLQYPTDIARDSTGRLYVTDNGRDSISVFGASARGNIPPVRSVRGSNTRLNLPSALALDSNGRIYVSNEDNGLVTIYRHGANGNVGPIRVISGGFNVGGVALDRADRIYIGGLSQNGSPILRVYRAGANGAARPVRTLAGPRTDTHESVTGTAVLLDPRNNVWAALWGAGLHGEIATVNYYSAVLPLAPSAVRYLRVFGRAGALHRTIRWRAPRNPGAARVTRYRVVVKKGNRKLFATRTTNPRVAVSRARLAAGIDTVTVQAINKYGPGAKALRSFRVRK